MTDVSSLVILGKVGRAQGLSGQVRIYSYADSFESFLSYGSYLLLPPEGEASLEAGVPVVLESPVVRTKAKGQEFLVTLLRRKTDHSLFTPSPNSLIGVPRAALPPLPEGRYYWRDLEGLEVRNQLGESLGFVESLMENTGLTVLIVKRDKGEKLYLPFQMESVVERVDLPAGVIFVHWDS